ncbi:AAA family ATPase [Solibacillus sp. FSL H8-0538]|uniref:AAA family ATPase n=1 Tax=Solibacillus sp. FSL H8-0538 TaxID=2921400 RepID=UPI0030F6C024
MGLLAEGYRKIATIVQLIANGTVQQNTILFWDEPESNINLKIVPVLAKLFLQLARMGVQLFISTHSYFIIRKWVAEQGFRLFDQAWINDCIKGLQFKKTEWDKIHHQNYSVISDKYRGPGID